MKTLIAILFTALSSQAFAELYRQVMPDGSIVYSNKPSKDAKKVDQPHDKVAPGQINRMPPKEKNPIIIPTPGSSAPVPPPPIGSLPPPPPGVNPAEVSKGQQEAINQMLEKKPEESKVSPADAKNSESKPAGQ